MRSSQILFITGVWPQIPTYEFKLQLVANCATLYKSLKYSLKQKYLLDMKITMNKIIFFFISVSLEAYRNCIYVDFNGLDTALHVKFIVDIYLRDKFIFLSSINSTCLQNFGQHSRTGFCKWILLSFLKS